MPSPTEITVSQLSRLIGLPDAFYRWARDTTGEEHDWQTANKTGTSQ